MMGMIAITIIAALLVAVSMVFLKISAATVTFKNWYKHLGFLSGTFLFGFANLLFVLVLRGNEVSVVFPLMSVQYIFTALISHWYLEEKLGKTLLLGIFCIMAGSVLILF